MQTFRVVYSIAGNRHEIEVNAMHAGAAKQAVIAMHNGQAVIYTVTLV